MSDDIKSAHASDAEPTATSSTEPLWNFLIVVVIVVTLGLLFFGGVYFDRHGGWFNPKVYPPYTTLENLEAFQPKSGAEAAAAQGKKVYEAVCGICHGVDGMGKPGQAPPLAGSEWVLAKSVNRLAHIPLAGLAGAVTVEGKEWNMNMAAMGAGLSDADLSAVLTYMRTSWGNKAGEVTADDIKKIRDSMGGHPQPMSGDQLKSMPE